MRIGAVLGLIAGLSVAQIAQATPQHALSMVGEPALPPGFAHLPYADPDAPKGGAIAFGEVGSFDSLNPFILKGQAAAGLRAHVFESLMGRSWDEPFTLYGLLAESVETDADRTWVEFTLRPEARFSDGTPVTVGDVLWSFRTLAEKGLPNFATAQAKVAAMVQTGPRSLRITFTEADRELSLILGLRPILKAADWDGRDFAASSLRIPVGSGPYRIEAVEAGRFVRYARNPDYWGRDLPLNRGQHNLDTIRYDYFRDPAARFEAFRGGALSALRESDPGRWSSGFDYPAVRDGRVVLSRIPHARPSGMRGFVFNTRRAIFADWRVREALILAFNFDWINGVLNGGAFRRMTSYFANSPLAFQGPAAGAEAALLAPYAADLPPGTLDGVVPPAGDPTGSNRRNLRRAAGLLEDAGWRVEDGILRDAAGVPFTFEILLRAADEEAVATVWRDALRALGIAATLRLADAAQYNERRNGYDFDVLVNTWALSLSPGTEQVFYWGSAGRTQPGTRNYMGADSPAIDAAIRALLDARTPDDLTNAARALDRVLMGGRYVVPFWYAPESWVAHETSLRFPTRLPLYGDWPGFLPEVWWRAP